MRYHRAKRSALLVWPTPKPRYYALSLALGVILGLLLVARNPAQAARLLAVRRGDDVHLLHLPVPAGTRIARGFYQDGVWSDSGFMPWSRISAVSWRDEGAVTLMLISHGQNWRAVWRCPGPSTAQARRVLLDRIKAHDIHIGGAGLNLGTRDEGDSI